MPVGDGTGILVSWYLSLNISTDFVLVVIGSCMGNVFF